MSHSNESPSKGEGRSRRDKALDAIESARADLIERAEHMLLHVLLREGEATADDLRGELGTMPEKDPRWIGSVFRRLATAGIIERVGFIESQRPEAHARSLALWKLIDRAGALHRLDESEHYARRIPSLSVAPAAAPVTTATQLALPGMGA